MSLTPGRAVLFDVDGTLLDVVANQRQVWTEWGRRHGLDPDWVYAEAVGTRPQETFAVVAPHLSLSQCIRALDEIEDEDVRAGDYRAFDGALELLEHLAPGAAALVTSNYERRVRARFERMGLPVPAVVVDADAVTRGKPDPEGYLTAARRLGVAPEDCLVIEDGMTGMRAGRAAGMTVWAVNVDAAEAVQAGAQRTFPSLARAAAEILAWQSGCS